MVKTSSHIIYINNKKTSIRLTQTEWNAVNTICEKENLKRTNLFNLINQNKNKELSLTASIRLFSIIYFQKMLLSKFYINKTQHSQPIFDAIKGIT